MADLQARTPCAGLLPVTIGAGTLSEETPGTLTVLMRLPGADVPAQITADIVWPKVGRTAGKAGARAVWWGRDEVMLMGVPAPDPLPPGVVAVDQSDAWAVVTLTGPSSDDVLARLVPVDLRARVFKRGHTVRTQLGHMNVSVTRTGPESFMIAVFRSMAATVVHELSAALEAVAARG
ncbi:sarcosine oxidase subunit gamma [Sulfitobacter sp. S190]|uniref:sarcosine oxidase subunit gamma n=1 Tax=Sulfitobacter sp. S190 TaxID=2867022 RepID=UPI0021A9584D|nr:sarcosine oxidase subunit gamma [Sulfitobacter sp. S190]UWR23537.1 sarcosine oxidase subunit gamma [Sulfitobacter sp. S190]